MEKMSLDACLGDLNEIAYSAEHVKLWVELYSGSCDVYRFERTEKEPRMNSLIWRNLKVLYVRMYSNALGHIACYTRAMLHSKVSE